MKPTPSSMGSCNGLGERSVRRFRAFTMLELMIVVAIMGIILAMATPSIRSALHKEAFIQGLNDILDACDFARKEAIVHGTVMEMRIYPQSGRIEVGAVARDRGLSSDVGPSANSPHSAANADAPPPPVIHSYSAQLSDRIGIEMLDVNFTEYKEADVARVRFYPNGTSYGLRMVIRSDSGEYRKITLEEVTALAEAGPFP